MAKLNDLMAADLAMRQEMEIARLRAEVSRLTARVDGEEHVRRKTQERLDKAMEVLREVVDSLTSPGLDCSRADAAMASARRVLKGDG